MKKHYCWNCNKVEIPKPVECCSGKDCCCVGLPIDPPFCSPDCQDLYFGVKAIYKGAPTNIDDIPH